MKKIEQSIVIDASKEKVWDVLTLDKLNRIWYAEFSEGTYALTDWEVDSKVIFTDNAVSGLIATVVSNKPNEELILEYLGELKEGMEDFESESAQNLKGGRETYRLLEKDGKTQLDVTGDMGSDFYDMMSESWERALQKIKELSEGK